MKKLTADTARALLARMKENESNAGLTIRDSYMLQALEIALPVLEQQESTHGQRAALIVGGKWVTANEGDPDGKIRAFMESCTTPQIDNDGREG